MLTPEFQTMVETALASRCENLTPTADNSAIEGHLNYHGNLMPLSIFLTGGGNVMVVELGLNLDRDEGPIAITPAVSFGDYFNYETYISRIVSGYTLRVAHRFESGLPSIHFLEEFIGEALATWELIHVSIVRVDEMEMPEEEEFDERIKPHMEEKGFLL